MLTVSLPWEGIGLMVGEGFNLSGTQTYYYKNVLITHTKCQLNAVQLTCTLVGEGIQKLKRGICQRALKNQPAILGFLHPNCSFKLQPLFTHLISDLRADCCRVTSTNQSMAMRGHFLQNGLCPRATI